MKYPVHLQRLIESFKRLPGVGNKTAERFAFQMLEWKEGHLKEFASLVEQVPMKLKTCEECGCLEGEEGCAFCLLKRQEAGSLCVTASLRDVFALEATREFHGIYHVLGGLLSPLEGLGPEALRLGNLKPRIRRYAVTELIIALDSTLEGDATALYIKNEMEGMPLRISRLAFGLPMGSSLDYVDGSTLARSFAGRGSF